LAEAAAPNNSVFLGAVYKCTYSLTHKPTNKQTHKQTGPITIHCAAKLSAQCNYIQI